MAKTRTSWQQGVSGNRTGRPRVVAEIRDEARRHGPRIIEILAEMAGVEGPGTSNEAVRLAAARELLDRAYGRATQPVSGDSSAGPLHIEFTWADAVPPEPEPIAEVDDAKTLATRRSP